MAFSYHFYGHTGEPYNRQIADNGITESIKVAELEFNKDGKLSEGCMLIVEKEGERWSVEPVPLDEITQFTKDKWRYLWVFDDACLNALLMHLQVNKPKPNT